MIDNNVATITITNTDNNGSPLPKPLQKKNNDISSKMNKETDTIKVEELKIP